MPPECPKSCPKQRVAAFRMKGTWSELLVRPELLEDRREPRARIRACDGQVQEPKRSACITFKQRTDKLPVPSLRMPVVTWARFPFRRF